MSRTETLDDPPPAGGTLETPEQLTALYDNHARPLHHYLARRAGTQVADDLVADAFLVVWEQRANFDPTRASPRAWLYGVATNLLRRHIRSEVRRLRAWAHDHARRDAEDDVSDRATERAHADAMSATLAGELAALRDEERDVLLLTAWAGLTPAEIGAVLDVPVATVRTRLHRARSRLRDRLGSRPTLRMVGPTRPPSTTGEETHR